MQRPSHPAARWALILAVLVAAGCDEDDGGQAADETERASTADESNAQEPTGSEQADRADRVVRVYSHRHYEVDKQLYDQFEEQTGIAVEVVKANADELIERLATEGERTPADLLITADAGRLVRAQEAGLLRPTDSDALEQRIPAHLRAPDGSWFALTKRARVFTYDKTRTDPAKFSTYEALAEPDMNGDVLIRSSTNIYNQSLLASLIAHHGEERAEAWAESIVENMARTPRGNDRDQMKALAAGQGEVAVVNTYYVGLLVNSDVPAERSVGEKMGVFFPNQDGRGAHINISGAGVTKHAKRPENAVRLLEFLVSDEAQAAFAEANYEYPVVEGVEPSSLLAQWGDFEEDELALTKLGEHNDQAVQIFDRAGWR